MHINSPIESQLLTATVNSPQASRLCIATGRMIGGINTAIEAKISSAFSKKLDQSVTAIAKVLLING